MAFNDIEKLTQLIFKLQYNISMHENRQTYLQNWVEQKFGNTISIMTVEKTKNNTSITQKKVHYEHDNKLNNSEVKKEKMKRRNKEILNLRMTSKE